MSLSLESLERERRYNAAVDFVERHVSERGDAIAFIDDAGTTTYRALADRVARAATVVREVGVLPEQRVVLCLHDTVDFPTLFFGAMRAGAVPVPINTLLTTEDYAFLLADSRAKAVFVSDALFPKMAPAIASLPAETRPRVVVVRSPLATSADVASYTNLPALDTLLASASPSAAFPTSPDDVAFWLYSSGSTGTPKGAIHLHAHLRRTAALYGEAVLGIRPDDVVFSAAKLFFAYGLGNAMTFPLYAGATAILLAERPTPDAVARTFAKHAPTIFCGVPTLFASLLANPDLATALAAPVDADADAGRRRLRTSISAGEALPKHVGERWRARIGSDILDGIGSTEMLHIFLSNRPDDVRYGTSGKPVAGYDCEIRDERGLPCADGEEGALWVKGPSCCVAYWNQREKSLATFHGPWTNTGDRYIRDEEGYYTYSGRGDDMLKVGGIWVSPFEVESALASHDAVLEAAVVGHADADGLVKPRAIVVLASGQTASTSLADDLRAFVKTRLAPYKYPRWIEFTDELPKTATGKIQRFKLRA